MKMDKLQTKGEIQKLWVLWRQRKDFRDTGSAALLFYADLEARREPILVHGAFGSFDPYQAIHSWVLEWNRTWGRNQ